MLWVRARRAVPPPRARRQAEAVDVSRPVVLLGNDLFRCLPGRVPVECRAAAQPCPNPVGSEIDQPGMAIVAEQDLAGSDPQVHHAPGVHGGQRRADLCRNPDQRIAIEPCRRIEGRPVDMVSHDQDVSPLSLGAVDAEQSGMGDLRGCGGGRLPRGRIQIGERFRVDELEQDLPGLIE